MSLKLIKLLLRSSKVPIPLIYSGKLTSLQFFTFILNFDGVEKVRGQQRRS